MLRCERKIVGRGRERECVCVCVCARTCTCTCGGTLRHYVCSQWSHEMLLFVLMTCKMTVLILSIHCYDVYEERLGNIFRELRKTGSHPGLNRGPLTLAVSALPPELWPAGDSQPSQFSISLRMCHQNPARITIMFAHVMLC